MRPFDAARPLETLDTDGVDTDVDGLRRVGVEGREFGLEEIKFGELAEICGLEVGVDGLELKDGLGLSMDELDDPGRILDGVEARDEEVRVGVEGLAVDDVRELGEEGLMYDETEAELVLRMEDGDRLEEKELYCEVEMDGRVAELLLAGREEWKLLSDCETES